MGSKMMIDIVSDTVCPWCFIGKRRLETALRQLQGQRQFEVRWHPFQLNPDASQAGVNKLEYYKQKFGEQRTKSMVPTMTVDTALTALSDAKETFAKEGLNYTMEGQTGNTLNSHRLIAFAGRQGADVQDRVVEQLFKAYFTEGKYINDPEVLREAAEKAGVADAEQVLSDPSVAKDQVREELREYAAGVTGVPHFIINGKYHLSGAQDPERLAQVLAKA